MHATKQLQPLTRHDHQSLPDGGPRYELIQGQLVMAPAPNRKHQQISRNLEFLLLRFFSEHPIGELYHAPFNVYFSNIDVLQPDILFVSNQRQHILTEQGAEGAPDLVVEILSPRSAINDRNVKRDIYARFGVTEYWIIDPEAETLAVYEFLSDPNQPARTLQRGQPLTSSILRGFQSEMDAIFDLFKAVGKATTRRFY